MPLLNYLWFINRCTVVPRTFRQVGGRKPRKVWGYIYITPWKVWDYIHITPPKTAWDTLEKFVRKVWKRKVRGMNVSVSKIIRDPSKSRISRSKIHRSDIFSFTIYIRYVLEFGIVASNFLFEKCIFMCTLYSTVDVIYTPFFSFFFEKKTTIYFTAYIFWYSWFIELYDNTNF